jgi:hypothetical protein
MMFRRDAAAPPPVTPTALLWCMRQFVRELKHGIAAQGEVQALLDRLGAPGAAVPLRQFMLALSAGCARMIDVRCICQAALSDDERALLDVLGLAQALRPFEAMLVLRGFVTPEGAAAALPHAEAIGHALAEAGRFLPTPDEELRQFAFATACGTGHTPAAFLH